MKNALETLGFGPCYHMMEVIRRPEHVPMWHRLAFGEPVDWDVLFKDFNATVDWPACSFWRELAKHYPSAKVLLSVRNPENWWQSMNDTIYRAMKIEVSDKTPPLFRLQREMARELVLKNTFHDQFEDKAHAIGVFERHTENVRANIDPARLLIYDVKEGWGPLCGFLGVAEPADPFPRLNDTASTKAMIEAMIANSRE